LVKKANQGFLDILVRRVFLVLMVNVVRTAFPAYLV